MSVRLRVKAVPGAKREAVAGMVGDRLKIKVSAPPEGGKANAAICKLLARTLGIRPAGVTIEAGATNPEKIVRIGGVSEDAVRESLGEGCDAAIQAET